MVRLSELACGLRPENVAICEMRKFCRWILPGLTDSCLVLDKLNGIDTLEGFKRLLLEYLNALERNRDTAIHAELLPRQTLDTVEYR